MSKDGNTSILKFIGAKRESVVHREYVDHSTPRSCTQHKTPHCKHCSPTSYSPFLSMKRKRRLMDSDLTSQTRGGIKKYITMSGPPKSEKEKTTPVCTKRKLSPDLEDLRNEMKTDTQELLAPIRDSL